MPFLDNLFPKKIESIPAMLNHSPKESSTDCSARFLKDNGEFNMDLFNKTIECKKLERKMNDE